MEPIEVQCPYCWSWFETEVDTSAGNQDYIEDCSVCCQPIRLAITLAEDGCVQSVEATRSD
ncbi:MAG: CPXCG motif-containing cysteine-rich protein [Gammaproteobacteria bacterium]|nr:CPXCG motif-containing cysteine-rich protein [Gammaproteobacteria bacterium]